MAYQTPKSAMKAQMASRMAGLSAMADKKMAGKPIKKMVAGKMGKMMKKKMGPRKVGKK